MGQGIARVCAAAGFATKLYDSDPGALERGLKRVVNGLDKDVEKGRLDRTSAIEIRDRLTAISSIQQIQSDIVIEAIVERLDVKQRLFKEIEAGSGTAILATNTSSLSVSAIAEGLTNPGCVVGLHFFNPAERMHLVEVIAGRKTEPAILEKAVEFTRQLGKTPAVAKDSPGFIVNRVARPYYCEALRALEEGAATVSAVDTLLRSAGFRMGPFELMDLIGIDTNFSVTTSVYEALGNAVRFTPSPVQKSLIEKGHLGRKTGKGFYDYEKN